MKHRINILFLAVAITSICLLFNERDYFLLLLILAFLVFFLILSAGVLFMKFNYFLNSVIKTNSEVVLLSFDDGPDIEHTPKVLDILKAHNIKALFFVIGQKAEQNPALIKRIIEEGHILGNHSYSHNNFMSLFSSKRLKEELSKSQETLENISNTKIRFFRPPVGYTNPNYARVLKEMKLTCVGWRLRSYDSVITDHKKLAKRLIKGIRQSDIVLLHDNRPATSKAIVEFIDQAKKNGIIFASEENIKTLIDEK